MLSKSIGARVLLVLLALLLMSAPGYGEKTKRLLLVGDSWPMFMWSGAPGIDPLDPMDPPGRVFMRAMEEMGYGQYEEQGRYTAIGTTMALEWAQNQGTVYGFGKLDGIRNELAAYPNIDICHVSLSGNDYGRADYRGVIPYTEYEMQSIGFTFPPTGGTFTLTFNGQTTTPLNYDATAAEVQDALEDLSSIGADNIEVVDTSGGARYFCTFKGPFAGTAVPMMSINNVNLTPAYLSTTIDHEGGYAAGANYINIVEFPLALREGFTLTVAGNPGNVGIDLPTPPNPDDKSNIKLNTTLSASVADGAEVRLLQQARVNGIRFNHGWQWRWGAFSPAENIFFDAVCDQIRVVIEVCLDARPDIRVALCDYDLMNDSGGEGTVQDKNEAGARCALVKYALTQEISAEPEYLNRCFYIGPFGLMQYTFGYPSPGTAEMPEYSIYGPNGTPGTVSGETVSLGGGYPDYTPFFGGDSRYPSPLAAILPELGGGDIHLNFPGYMTLARFCMNEFYASWLDLPKVLKSVRATENPVVPGVIFNPVWRDEVEFDVTFSEPVTGVDVSDFYPITHGGAGGAAIAEVQQLEPNVYRVTVQTGSGEGGLELGVTDNGTIIDADSNPLNGDVDGRYEYGEVYSLSRNAALPLAAAPAALAILLAGLATIRRRK